MFAVNLLAIGAAAIALARLSTRLGARPGWGSWPGSTRPWSRASRAAWPTPWPWPWPCGGWSSGGATSGGRWCCSPWPRSRARPRSSWPPRASSSATAGQRRWLLIPPGVFLAWMAVVSIWLPATPGKGKGNIIQDATGELTIPFRAWVHLGLGIDGHRARVGAARRLAGRRVEAAAPAARGRPVGAVRRRAARVLGRGRGRAPPQPGPGGRHGAARGRAGPRGRTAPLRRRCPARDVGPARGEDRAGPWRSMAA